MNGNQLKLIMIGLMTLDHLVPLLPPQFSIPFHIISRCVAVFFGFMAVEGFHYTRNRKKYLVRLYGFSAIMFVGNTLINTLIIKNSMYQIHNNIFLTLAIGVTILCLLDFAKGIKEPFIRISTIVLAILLILSSFLSLLPVEGGSIVIPFMLLSYLFRDNAKKRDLSYLIFSIFLIIITLIGLPDYSFEIIKMQLEVNPEFLFITVIPFIHLYNGEKGSNNPIFKYLFYVFYPAHIWLIMVINFYLNQA